ncbi:hypothetical protein [Methylobacterium nigriterrae]|uniref:hypothetical protein n=1 Tax=Methylobacterium nigriterrae TaxID=3127512 RepID=UPI0030133DD1
MEIPEAYSHYAASFYPYLDEETSSVEEFIARGLRFLTDDQFDDLQAFLPRALAGGCKTPWLRLAVTDWYVDPSGYRRLFSFVHDHLRDGL